MSDLLFRSDDSRYGLCLTEECIQRILELCSRSGGSETGGVLIGHYTESLDMAVVTTATEPPPDSKSGKNWFRRGVRGLNARLDEHWQERQFYLGEWHLHPRDVPDPSPTDEARMGRIANLDAYVCATPVLLIVGGDPEDEWLLGAYAFPVGEQRVHLRAWK